jgi:hypothetical protein
MVPTMFTSDCLFVLKAHLYRHVWYRRCSELGRSEPWPVLHRVFTSSALAGPAPSDQAKRFSSEVPISSSSACLVGWNALSSFSFALLTARPSPRTAWHLLWDFRTLNSLARVLPQSSPLQNKAMVTANQILNVFKWDDLSTIDEARKLAEEVLGKGWWEKGDKVYEEGGRAPSVAISNCHMYVVLSDFFGERTID